MLAGWSTTQMLDGIGPILHLAEAGTLDLGRASDLVTDSMSALSLEVKDLPQYLDKVAQTSRKSNTDIDALMEAMVIAGGSFSRFNVPLEEANAFLGVLANRGFKGAQAGTAVNAIMGSLTSGTGAAAKGLKKMGVSAFDANGDFRGMEVVMTDIKDKLAGMTEEQQANALAMIAGKEHGKTFGAMLNGLGMEYQDLKQDIIDSDGALIDMRNTMKDNLTGALENLSSAFEEMAIAIGTELLPYVKEMVKFVQSLADKFNGLDDSTKKTIAIVATMAAGFLLLFGPILMIVGFIPSIVAGFTAVSTVIGAIASPIGLVVLAIVGIVAALVVAYAKIEWFRDIVNGAWEVIKTEAVAIFNTVKEAVMDAVSSMVKIAETQLEKLNAFWAENGEQILATAKEKFEAVKETVTNVITAIVDFIKPQLEKIKTFWAENGSQIFEAVKNVFNGIKAVIDFIMPAIRFLIEMVWTAIKQVISGALDVIMGLVKVFSGLFTGDFSKMWEGVKQLFFGAIDLVIGWMTLTFVGGIRTLLANLLKGSVGTIKSMWTGIVDFFKSFSTNASNLAKNMATGVVNYFKNLFTQAKNIFGMLRTFGASVWNAIKEVIIAAAKGIYNKVKSNFTNLLNSVKNIFGTVKSAIKTIWDSVMSFFKGINLRQIGIDIIQGLINGIGSMASAVWDKAKSIASGIGDSIKSMLGIASPSKVTTELGKWTGQGLANGVASTKDANVKAITSVTKVITDVTKKNADEIAKIDEDNEKKRTAIRSEYAKKRAELDRKTAQSSQSVLKTSKNKKGQIVTTGTQKVHNIRANASAQLIKLNDDEQKKLVAANDKAWAAMQKKEAELTKDKLEAIKTYIADKKSMDQLSIVAETEVWRKSIALFKEGTKERVEVQKGYQASLKAVNDEIVKTNEEYAGKMTAISEKLRSDEDSLTDLYMKSLEDRAKSLVSFAGLFDFFEVKIEKTGGDLLENLKSQVSGFVRWQQEIEMLANKAIDKGLIAELREMGPKALPELIALNSMTDSQLTEYSTLYQKKSELARQQAENELIGMKEDTKKRIDDLRAVANKELETLRNEWTTKIKSVTKATNDELKSLKQIGKQAGQGLMDGMASMQPALVSKAKSIADSVKKAMESAFKIKSPSRWMRDHIGVNMMQGWINGIQNMKSAIIGMSLNATDWMTPDVPQFEPAYSSVGDTSNSMSKAINGSIDVNNSAENRLLMEIRDELRKQKEIIVEMDSKKVGKIVSQEQERMVTNKRRGGFG